MVLGTERNRGNALTRRRQLDRVGIDADRALVETVTVARATAGGLVARLETAVREQRDLQTDLLAALHVMDSPDQAAAQTAAATETARADAATARAQAVAAQSRTEQAETHATRAEVAEHDLVSVRDQLAQARAAADARCVRSSAWRAPWPRPPASNWLRLRRFPRPQRSLARRASPNRG